VAADVGRLKETTASVVEALIPWLHYCLSAIKGSRGPFTPIPVLLMIVGMKVDV